MSGGAGKRSACVRTCAPGAKRLPTATRWLPSPAAIAFAKRPLKVFVTGSFWCGTVAMAAARATVRIARETDVAGHIRAMGLRLREGLASLPRKNMASRSARAARRRCH